MIQFCRYIFQHHGAYRQAEKHMKAHPLEKHLSECLAEWKMYIKMMKAGGFGVKMIRCKQNDEVFFHVLFPLKW